MDAKRGYGGGKPPEPRDPMVTRGIQDLIAGLPQLPQFHVAKGSGLASVFDSWLSGGNGKPNAVGTTRDFWRLDKSTEKPNATSKSGASRSSAATPSLGTFRDGWGRHLATNPRLRDPKAFPALLWRAGPPAELRAEVWSHLLGLRCFTVSDLSPASVARAAMDDAAATVEPNTTDHEASMADQDQSLMCRPPSTTTAQRDFNELPETDEADLPSSVGDLIDADVSRTFASNEDFKEIEGQSRLRRLLRRLALEDKEVGYCQSLNFVAALFLIVLRDEAAALAGLRQLLLKLGTKSWYTDGMRQLRADNLVLEELIHERLPSIHETFRQHKFDLLFVSSKWFLCLFATTLDGEALRRVWDVILCDGIEAVIRVSLVLLSRRGEAIAKAKSMDDLMHIFKEGARTEPCPEALLRDAYNPAFVGQLGRAELAQRRQAAFRKIGDDDTRLEMRTQWLWRGGVRPASILARG